MKSDFCEKLKKEAVLLGVSLNDLQLEQLFTYYEMLIEKNKVMNLTAITEPEEVITKHFADSLSLSRCPGALPAELLSSANADGSKVLPAAGKAASADNGVGVCRLLDVGTGAGFPGLVLKIAFPALDVTLFDSLKKRLTFLEEVIAALGLKGVRTLHGRAEDYGRDKACREHYDLVVSRAVANLAVLSEYCLPFVKTGGCFVAYKTAEYQEELENAGKAIRILGGSPEHTESFTLPGTDIGRSLLLIRKEKSTPAVYPRKAGVPAKEPLK